MRMIARGRQSIQVYVININRKLLVPIQMLAYENWIFLWLILNILLAKVRSRAQSIIVQSRYSFLRILNIKLALVILRRWPAVDCRFLLKLIEIGSFLSNEDHDGDGKHNCN